MDETFGPSRRQRIANLAMVLGILAIGLIAVICRGAETSDSGKKLQWHENVAPATELARKENKILMLDFTGSDWCGYCIKIKKNVFDTPEFATWAQAKLVLVEIDFPQNKAQDPQTKARNKALAEKFKVDGFPTLVFLDANGNELTRSEGYAGEAPAQWIADRQKELPK